MNALWYAAVAADSGKRVLVACSDRKHALILATTFDHDFACAQKISTFVFRYHDATGIGEIGAVHFAHDHLSIRGWSFDVALNREFASPLMLAHVKPALARGRA